MVGIPALACGEAKNITETGDVGVATQGYVLLGFYVNSTTSGTLILRVGGSGGISNPPRSGCLASQAPKPRRSIRCLPAPAAPERRLGAA